MAYLYKLTLKKSVAACSGVTYSIEVDTCTEYKSLITRFRSDSVILELIVSARIFKRVK